MLLYALYYRMIFESNIRSYALEKLQKNVDNQNRQFQFFRFITRRVNDEFFICRYFFMHIPLNSYQIQQRFVFFLIINEFGWFYARVFSIKQWNLIRQAAGRFISDRRANFRRTSQAQ